MSTALLKTAAIAAISIAGLAVTANAQSSRYGGHTIASYEGVAQDCAPSNCVAPAPLAASRYGSVQTVAPTYNQAPVMVDCSLFAQPACGPQMIIQPQTVYTQPTYAQAAPQVEIYEDSYSAPPANCPAGTTPHSDGTCHQNSAPTYIPAPTYSAPAPVMSAPVNCPAGTMAQSDGTCMQTGMTTTPTYTGDATPSYGYGTDGSYGTDAYRPIRK